MINVAETYENLGKLYLNIFNQLNEAEKSFINSLNIYLEMIQPDLNATEAIARLFNYLG